MVTKCSVKVKRNSCRNLSITIGIQVSVKNLSMKCERNTNNVLTKTIREIMLTTRCALPQRKHFPAARGTQAVLSDL